MKLLRFKASKHLPEYHSLHLNLQHGELCEVDDARANYLLTAFPGNFEQEGSSDEAAEDEVADVEEQDDEPTVEPSEPQPTPEPEVKKNDNRTPSRRSPNRRGRA